MSHRSPCQWEYYRRRVADLNSLGRAQHLLIGRQRGHNLIYADQILTADVVFVLYRVQLGFEHVVLLRQLHNSLLQDHIIEATLLAGTLCRFIVAAPPIPVAVVLLVVRDKFPLFALGEQLLALQMGRQIVPVAVEVLIAADGTGTSS